ncbi:helix-turn-helix domain-containing protein [Duncaniella freteri]|uniref:helix-turn-helix domain-containing protein n=2 Tax=Duncaniella TaxID=2518495 RepID=UPI00256ECADC|nr:helix-turn-helix domain-containing protein [Duncaniella freteri]
MANVADHYRILKHPLPMIDNKAQISLQVIYDKLTELHAQLKNLPETSPYIYDNKSLISLLGVKDRYLKRLRDNGLLGYSRHGDKYWYTQSDVDRFLARCHFAPFGLK